MIRQLWAVELPGSTCPGGMSSTGNDRARIRRKVTRLVVVVCAVFAVCWAPSHVLWIWSNFAPLPRRYTFYYARVAAHALSYGNSAMNPVIYAFLSANFRKGFQRAIYCRRGADAAAEADARGHAGHGSTPRSAVTTNHHVTLTSQATGSHQGRRSLVCIGKSFSQDTNANSSFL